ncbi:MAG: DUF2236 domain-containing protein [Ktedonobacteraceae bacterium]|nr:DUF2236 domain-containing protein [Ktedonobacteraceae bacterium]
MQDQGYFGKNSITWKVARESILNLGGARAVLMQLAHPLVAMGVSEHSSYLRDPLRRTMSTFMLGQMLTFGSTQTARRAAHAINSLHRGVRGSLPFSAGAYRKGTPYSASDPRLLLWVHATLVDTILLMYPLFIGPLSPEEQDRYYQESKRVAALLGLDAADMPATVNELRRYVDVMVHSDQLAATPQARQLARVVLFPPVPAILRPLLLLQLQLTIALLPQRVREIYGLEWGSVRQTLFHLTATGMRTVLPRLPASMRILPVTQKLM